jgi:hypothetical protein
MGQAKRRKQLLGDVYGQVIPLEQCTVPEQIHFGFVGDYQMSNSKKDLAKMSSDFKSMLLACVLKAQEISDPGLIFAETIEISGKDEVEIIFRSDFDTFIQSRCNVDRHQGNRVIEKLKQVDYSAHRVIALLDEPKEPLLTISVYTLTQLETLHKNLKKDMGDSL